MVPRMHGSQEYLLGVKPFGPARHRKIRGFLKGADFYMPLPRQYVYA